MSRAEWRERVVDYIRAEAQPVDKFTHQPRLYRVAVEIGQGLEYDDDVLFAAAWLHDLGVFRGHRPNDPKELEHWDHIPYTIARSRELLAGWGFPEEKMEAVAEAIRNHQPGSEPLSLETEVLRDADILEQLGAVGMLRNICKLGRDTRYSTFSDIVQVLRNALNELPAKLRQSKARAMAVPRVEILRAFLQAVEAETQGLLD